MKEIRCPKTACISKGKGKVSAPPKPGQSPGSIDTFEAPPIPAGEDIHSFERHNRVLKAQYAKSHPNQQNNCIRINANNVCNEASRYIKFPL